MDDLVISKIGQYMIVSEVYQVVISRWYFDNLPESMETQMYMFQKYSNLYSQICDYIKKLDTEYKEDIVEISINSKNLLVSDLPLVIIPPNEKNIPSNKPYTITINSVTKGDGYDGGHEYTTRIKITKINLSDSNNSVIKPFGQSKYYREDSKDDQDNQDRWLLI
jgi:hypothetical protein